MKALVVIFAGEITPYALEHLAGGSSALSRAVVAATALPDVSRLVLFCAEHRFGGALCPDIGKIRELAGKALATSQLSGNPDSVSPELGFRLEPSWNVNSFLAAATEESSGFDTVYVIWADSPFIDTEFAQALFAKHIRYAAEYTFADGYPSGLSPDILARGAVPIIAKLAESDMGPVTRTTIFDSLKKEINSFDIETELAPVDLRQLRITLACDTRRNTTRCAAYDGITAKNYAEIIAGRSDAQFGVPAFYGVQVAGRCPFACIHCPYPAFSSSGKGDSPGTAVTERTDVMSIADFSMIINKIATYSEDAVVSLSLWGECSYHPDVPGLVRAVLAHPGLSVLIETTGIGWKDSDFEEIVRITDSAAPRIDGKPPVSWIVSLDAAGTACYGEIHGVGDNALADRFLREALSVTERLSNLFPDSVWPQMIRMNENEEELETFFRFWKQKTGRVIIQKHDHFCRSISDRRVADLSPLVRHPCWHLKRDLNILIDGTVPLCREDLYASRSMGNALTDTFDSIRRGIQTEYLKHSGCVYSGMCGDCDEYYTYNF